MDSGVSRAWILNLDAERELAHPERSVDPFAALEQRPQLSNALAALVGDDRIVTRNAPRADTRDATHGLTWCPTPSALAACARAGVAAPRAPSIDVLRRVNHRAFCSELGPTLDEAGFASTVEDALAWIARPSPSGSWI